MKLDKISVIVTCYNEVDRIGRCLESVRAFRDIIVVDSFSTDNTVEVVRRSGAVLYLRSYKSAADQKNWAIEQARQPWVLILDADEALSESALEAIERLEPGRIAGYSIRRRSQYLGAVIRGCGWQRDKVVRLFDRSRGRYGLVEVHEEVVLDGRLGVLGGWLWHAPYRDTSHHFEKMDEYSSRGARDFAERGGRWPVFRMLIHPPLRFFRMFVLQWGFLDGWRGALLCLMASYSVFLKYAKAWELQRCRDDA